MKKDSREQLQDFLESGRLIRFERRPNGEELSENYGGYLLGLSADLVCFKDFIDFDEDGYTILPIWTISKVLTTRANRYFDKMLHLEGLAPDRESLAKIDLTSWATIFKDIRELGLNVSIENERPGIERFDIGEIKRVTQEAVYIRYFDAEGFMDNYWTKCLYEEITLVRFDTRYINIFSKHLRERKNV